jgi:lipid-A-disaccharide synthase
MLTLFPFEEAVYREYGIPVTCVGHPLADEIPLEDQRAGARARLGLAPDVETAALLPGSRLDEVRRLAGVFLEAARWCRVRRPGLRILAAMAGPRVREVFEGIRSDRCAELPVEVIEGRSRDVLAAADVVLVASGTATLEAMLLRRPMVVAYRLHPLTYRLVRALVRIPRVALPNVLSGEDLVPEFLQREATPERLGGAVLHWLEHPAEVGRLTARFAALHHELRRGASERAAEAVLESACRPGGAP